MSICKVTFRKRIPEGRKAGILDDLIHNLSGSYHLNIEKRGDNKLSIEADLNLARFYQFPSRNLWSVFSNKAEVSIENNEVFYTVYYSDAVYSVTFAMLFLSAIIPFFIEPGPGKNIMIYSILLIDIYIIMLFAYQLLLHRNLLIYTLKHGSRFRGEYDWEHILKTKTIKELESIAKGNTTLTEEVQELARKELSDRMDKR